MKTFVIGRCPYREVRLYVNLQFSVTFWLPLHEAHLRVNVKNCTSEWAHAYMREWVRVCVNVFVYVSECARVRDWMCARAWVNVRVYMSECEDVCEWTTFVHEWMDARVHAWIGECLGRKGVRAWNARVSTHVWMTEENAQAASYTEHSKSSHIQIKLMKV